MKRYAAPLFVIFQIVVCLSLALGCSLAPKPQRGGRAQVTVSSSNMVAIAQQPENPSGPASQSQEWLDETFFTLPAGSIWNAGQGQVTTEAQRHGEKQKKEPPEAGTLSAGFVLSVAMPVRQVSRRVSSATVGAAHKDEARSLGVRLQAMRPVQWTGIALCVGSIAAFYFGWPTIGFLAIAIGGGMIAGAAVLPGHETLLLIVGAIGLAVAALLVVYAYHKGKIHVFEDHVVPKPA